MGGFASAPIAAWLCTLLLAVSLSIWFLGRLRSRRIRRTRQRIAARAQAGEIVAADLLEDAGYQILEHQPKQETRVWVDGSLHVFPLSGDFLVERNGLFALAEVKTGKSAGRIDFAPTRRQLLEYRLAFPVDSLLLVDVDTKRIQEVVFGGVARQRS